MNSTLKYGPLAAAVAEPGRDSAGYVFRVGGREAGGV